MPDAATRHAPEGQRITPPPAIMRITPLALAALELGVDSDDVLEHLRSAGAYTARVSNIEAIEATL